MDSSPPDSSVHGISQAKTPEWVAISYSGDLPNPGIEPVSPALAGRFFTIEPPGKLYNFWIFCMELFQLTYDAFVIQMTK